MTGVVPSTLPQAWLSATASRSGGVAGVACTGRSARQNGPRPKPEAVTFHTLRATPIADGAAARPHPGTRPAGLCGHGASARW